MREPDLETSGSLKMRRIGMENSRQLEKRGSQFDLPYGQLRILEAFQDKFSGLSPQILIGIWIRIMSIFRKSGL